MSKDITPEELVEKWIKPNKYAWMPNPQTDALSDLTSVIRGKLVEFVCKLRGCHPESKYGELLIEQIDKFLAENGLNNNQ